MKRFMVSLEESKLYLNKYENWLWQLTKYYLQPYAEFDHQEGSFYLVQNPFPNEKIHPGPYKIGKVTEEANNYRIGHPLAQRIIEKCKEFTSDCAELVFNYSETTDRKITIIETLVGKSGWLSLSHLSISSFETEDHLIFSGITNEYEELDSDQCTRLFSLPASINESSNPPQTVIEKLDEIKFKYKAEILGTNAQRNAKFFDFEMDKLDKWAEDKKNSLEIELKELDKDIKTRKTEAKKILKLEEKVKTQREIKELEKKRNELRLELFKSQDEVDERKENLISEIEQRLKQDTVLEQLFVIKWRVT